CAMAGLLVLALPIIRVLFERGEINAIHSVVFADTLKAYLLVVPIAAISGLLSRAYHALHSYKLPMYAALMAVPINITLDYLWLPEHGTPAAGWATAVAMLAQLLVLIAGLSRHHLALPLSIARSYTWVLPSVGVLFCSGYVHREFLVNHPITNLLASIIAGVIAAVVIMAVTRREDLVAFTRAVSKPK
ncbi:MAG: lipid II flippase MurJ, partial [Planctomycetota bacterium]|nr:lipid II flippase MurJ [Planctomycetota bacterium]